MFLISLQVSDIKKLEKSSPSIYRDVHGLPGLAKINKNHIQQVRHGQNQNQAMIFEYTQSIHYLFFDQQYEVLCLILQDKT